MRIVHTESSHGWGGQEIRILTESRELMKRGNEVILLADEESLIYKRAPLYGIKTETIRLKKKRLADLLSVVKALVRIAPDVVSCHSSTDHWLVSIARLFVRKGFAIVRTRHVSAPVRQSFPTRWLYNHGCEEVMTTGESIRNALTLNGFIPGERVTSVPTGLDLNYFKPNSRERARRSIGLPEDAFIFGNIATLRSWKGQEFLIRSFAQIAKKNTLLVIVGDGPQRDALHQSAIDAGVYEKVVFAGHQADVRPYLDAIDCFVFPSYANEGIPQSILQAIAYGLPIITTNAGSIAEAVEGYTLLTSVKCKDIASLVDSMAKASDRGNVGRLPLNTALRKRISIETMADNAVDVYRRAIENRKSK